MKNKNFKMKKWKFVFPDDAPLGASVEFAETFIESTMERDTRFTGVIVNYPVSLYGEACDDERFSGEGAMVLTSHIKSIVRVRRPSWLDRIFIWAWWLKMVKISYYVTTESGSVYEIKLRDADEEFLDLFDAHLCGEPLEALLVDVDIVVS